MIITEDPPTPNFNKMNMLSESFQPTPRANNCILRPTMTPSKSVERRLNEYAQFAKAVGEMPSATTDDDIFVDEHCSDDGECSDDDFDVLMGGEEIMERVECLSQTSRPLSCVDKSPEDDLLTTRANNRGTYNIDQLVNSFDIRLVIPLLGGLARSNKENDFAYRGIFSNPPEICKRGLSRGNYALLHRKAWLEVSDERHRYGKNLRFYYKFWESLGHPTNRFFDWLDSKGESKSAPLPELQECPRKKLDSDTVMYITDPAINNQYVMTIKNHQRASIILDTNGKPINTGREGWIFVLRDKILYATPKITTYSSSKQRFHHSSFFAGKAVAAAGIIVTDADGKLINLYPHSGHYRPGEAHIQRMLCYLHNSGIDLASFHVDLQQIMHVPRNKQKNTKEKKLHSLHLVRAMDAACYLAHKARMIGEGVFEDIHQITKL